MVVPPSPGTTDVRPASARIVARCASVLLVLAAACVAPRVPEAPPTAPPATEYRTPPAPVVDLLTAPRAPEPLLHVGASRIALLTRESVIPLERLARPFVGLAGFRFEPVSATTNRDPLVTRVEILTIDRPGETTTIVWEPAHGAVLDHVRFSPDGRRLSATAIGQGAARLVVFDVAEARETALSANVNAAWGAPCQWMDADRLLCRLVPEDRGAPPDLATGPMVVEHPGGRLPTRTYSNLLRNARDEALFEHYFTATLAVVDTGGDVRPLPDSRALWARMAVAPDGTAAVVSRVVSPYPHVVPAYRFPHVEEIWNLETGRSVRTLPALEVVAAGFPMEARKLRWRPGEQATLGWIELDPDGRADRWVVLDEPFDGAPRELVRTERAIDQFGWTTAGTPYFSFRSKKAAEVEVYAVFDGEPHEIWSGSTQDRYGNPGRALRTGGFAGLAYEADGQLFLAGDGLGPAGPEPFLDAFDLRTRETTRLFTSSTGGYEPVLGLLGTGWTITSRESETEPPTLWAHRGDEHRALLPVRDPFPALAQVERRLVRYQRRDGLDLEATLYLPPEASTGPLPTLVWIYPYEFTDRAFAEQSDVRRYRFHKVKGPSPLAVTLQGYALLLNPTMPIVGQPGEANDRYVTQLAANAEAAVRYLVDQGIADPDRIAIAGRSYGAFSAANLLVHTDLFRTGIAISGAYNRTLTPFGFQREYRSFWRESALYARVSPFFEADRIEEPLLLIHGAADENAGTRPSQARRFFHALVGNGVRVRYVELPYEGHHYWGRESVLHIASEMLDWLDRKLGVTETQEGS